MIRVLGLTAVCAVLGACAAQDKSHPSCGPGNQRGSYMAPVDSSQITVVMDSSAAAVPSLQSSLNYATDSWNTYAKAQLSRTFFTVSTTPVGQLNLPASNSDCASVGGSTDSVVVVAEDADAADASSNWAAMGLTAANPAVTIRCYDGNALQKQEILLNLHYVKTEQLTSIVLHELGHALGLNHSCQSGAGTSDYISCSGLQASDPYEQAVMFPTLVAAPSSNAVQAVHATGAGGTTNRVGTYSASGLPIKEALSTNDQERTNCLYLQ